VRRARNQRLISRCRVDLDHPTLPAEAESEDLSSSGLFVRSRTLYPVGDETDLRLSLPDGSIVALYARVVHVLTARAARAVGRHPGMGLELIGPDTPGRAKLRAHVESLRTEVTSPGWTKTTTVVVVEPSPPLRARIQRCLEAAGVTVTAVASATEALDACVGGQGPPDVIVAAAAMPVMTGVDLAYALSEHQALSEVPLVLVGDDGDLGRLEAFRAGVRDYVPVPFLDEELAIRVGRVTARASASGLRGSLDDIALGTLLSLLEFERKTGILLVLREHELARVFISGGKILKVETTSDEGTPKQRLMRLLDWSDGRFEFSPAEIGQRDEVGLSVTQLLLEHARVHDEAMPAPQRR
jgi:CheY-like chemotaxis protein/Tfp pilus assembly protein PilZ